MSGLMNSFYYGKAGKADFTPEQLPTNRVQLFFEMLRIRFSGLFGVNMLYLAFCIPAIAWSGFNLDVLSNSLDPETGAGLINFFEDGYLTIYLLGMIPCLALCGVGMSGTSYVLRNWARDQHSFVWSDFKDAIKGNWKSGLVIGLINGASLIVTYVCYQYYGLQIAQSAFWVVPQTFVVICCALWWMMNMVIFPMMVTYDMKLGQLIRNSAIITFARLPWSVLIWGLSVLIPFVLAMFVPYGAVVTVLFYAAIGFAMVGLIYASYANSCFDRFLNPRIEGAPVNMGLRDPDYDDEEDEEDA